MKSVVGKWIGFLLALVLVVGTIAKLGFSTVEIGPTLPNIVTPLTSGSTIAWDASQSAVYSVTITQDGKLLNPTNALAGFTYKLIITQDGTGGHALTFDTAFFFPIVTASGGLPTPQPISIATGANTITIIEFLSDGTNFIQTNLTKDPESQITSPSGLTASTNQSANVHLAWTNNATDATSVVIQQYDGVGGWFDIASVATSVSSYDDAESAGSYDYRIVAKRNPNYSVPSNTATGTAL